MLNYKRIPGINLNYFPLQDISIKTPNINGKRIPWKEKDYGLPDTWHESIKNYGIKLDNLLVIDIDNKSLDGTKPSKQEQQDCTFSLPRLTTILNILPILNNTYIEITQSGGFHIWVHSVPEFNRKQIDIGKNSIDLLTGSNFLACANTDNTIWKAGTYAVYNDSDTLASLSISQVETIIAIYGNKPDDDGNVHEIKGPDYYIRLSDTTGIPKGERDNALFQLMSRWHRLGYDIDEARSAYMQLTIQGRKEFEQEYNFDARYSVICAKEAGKSKNRLAWARSNMIYVKTTDEIYFVPDHLPRSVDKMKTRHRELFPTGQVSKTTGDPKYAQLVDIWLDLPDRTMVDGVGFCPNDNAIFKFNQRNYGNLYIDQRFKAWSEEVGVDDEDLELYLKMIYNMLENDERTVSLYLSSLAYKLTHLDSRQMWAWYLITLEKGIGKGLSWDIQAKLNGNYAQKASADKLTNQFNAFKFSSLNILVDEADDINKKSNGINAMNALKMLITDSFDNVHYKGKDIGLFQMPIFCSVEMHSNHAEKLKIDSNERRMAIVMCRKHPLPNNHYEKLGKLAFPKMDASDEEHSASERFFSKLTRFLTDYPLHPDFCLERAPDTLWKDEVCAMSRDAFTATLIQAFDDMNKFTSSDLQTQQSLRVMLEQEYKYKKLLDRDLVVPMEELEQIGIVKVIKARFSNPDKIEFDDDGYTPRLIKRAATWQPKLYAIRNHSYYEKQTSKELKSNFYPTAQKVK